MKQKLGLKRFGNKTVSFKIIKRSCPHILGNAKNFITFKNKSLLKKRPLSLKLVRKHMWTYQQLEINNQEHNNTDKESFNI